MKASINNTLLKNLPPGPVDIHDTRLIGFVLRVSKSGRGTYRAHYARGKAYTIGTTDRVKPGEAREIAKTILGDAAKGIDPSIAKKRSRASTLRDYINNVYGPWLRTHRKDGEASEARIRKCFDADLGGKKLHEITPWLIEKWKTRRLKEGRAPATISRDLGALKTALNRAVEWGYTDENPIRRVKPPKDDDNSAPRFLSGDEAKRLQKALDARQERQRSERDNANDWRRIRGYPLKPDLRVVPYTDHIKPLVLLALNTGGRRGELFNLAWPDVDLAGRTLTVRGYGAKSGQTRHIPLNDEAVSVLKGWQETTGAEAGLVFPGDRGQRLDNINSAWSGVLRDAGITAFRFHDLRHTFASWLVMAGVDLNTVRDLLGHADLKMTLRYAHLAPEHKAQAVAKLSAPKGQDAEGVA